MIKNPSDPTRLLRISLLMLAMGSLLALFANGCAEPQGTGYALEWSRTPIARGAPNGQGCGYITATATRAYPLLSADNGLAVAMRLPLQLKLTVSSTSPVMLCASQDPSPIINRVGRFSADSAGVYSAGVGPCLPLQPPADFFGMDMVGLRVSGEGTPVGSKPWSCSTSGTPCSVNSDCPSGGGTCTVRTWSQRAYIFAIFEAGAGSLLACDAR